jgi:hypothetical protein
MKNFAVFLILVIGYTACVHNSNISTVKNDNEPFRIALITLKISKIKNDYAVTLTNSRILEASPGKVDSEPLRWKQNDFYCLILDKNRHIRDSLCIEQPLSPRYEYPQENGKIGSIIVVQDENEVMLRFNFLKQYKWLRIGIVEKGNHFRTLNTIELTFKN